MNPATPSDTTGICAMQEHRGIWLPIGETHLQEHIDRAPLWQGRGTYQWEKLQAAIALVEPDRRGMALDVGAHVGLWSRPLADIFEAVMAVEPIPAHVACWHRNVRALNALLVEGVLVDHADPDARVPLLWEPGNTGSTAFAPGGSRMLEPEGQPDAQLIYARARTLDSLGLPTLDLLKIDCEGVEELVVLGGEETIRRCKPVVVIEQKKGAAPRHGLEDLGGKELLESWGAKVEVVIHGDYIMRWA